VVAGLCCPYIPVWMVVISLCHGIGMVVFGWCSCFWLPQCCVLVFGCHIVVFCCHILVFCCCIVVFCGCIVVSCCHILVFIVASLFFVAALLFLDAVASHRCFLLPQHCGVSMVVFVTTVWHCCFLLLQHCVLMPWHRHSFSLSSPSSVCALFPHRLIVDCVMLAVTMPAVIMLVSAHQKMI